MNASLYQQNRRFIQEDTFQTQSSALRLTLPFSILTLELIDALPLSSPADQHQKICKQNSLWGQPWTHIIFISGDKEITLDKHQPALFN